ncbi:ribonuclease T2 [Altererythrobacter atlanticus]|uniref:Ribonuclease T2 family protein n=1 Tax=Croceibacterium atlanticum TaxID=1267766 RepID=A0A0F7KS36_9SPHN|nr:ribonuclease T [Croceibacterium atlanticum]AKH43273.1 Ribonuclease T2 family protein [Croceibacterium atlanticum]MBB5732021.1 ribonuclease T2 [Croceibacterium atlanticum]
MRRAIAACAGAILCVPGIAHAQSYQCRVPDKPVSVPRVEQDEPTREMPVTGYTLALSWSPEYCRTRLDSPRDARQCSGRGGRFGFVVHGLWPDGTNGWPQWCPVRLELPARELARNLCMTPSARLLAQEWVKHGSCMSFRPQSYFKITRILWNSLRWPDFDRLSRRDGLTAGDIRKTFADANPHWEPEHVGVKLNSRGWLEELRLCYGADFLPESCDSRRWGPRDSTRAKIWRGL